MSLLDDVRELDLTPLPKDDDGGCWFCGQVTSEVGHKGRCPWLALPRIVAALELAEAVILTLPETSVFLGHGEGRHCRFCRETTYRGEQWVGTRHKADCRWLALQAALMGDA